MFFFKCKMNKILNKFLLVGNKFMPEMHLKNSLVLLTVLVVHLQKLKKELKISRQETQILFKETDLIKLVFNMIWHMANQKNKQKELNQTRF